MILFDSSDNVYIVKNDKTYHYYYGLVLIPDFNVNGNNECQLPMETEFVAINIVNKAVDIKHFYEREYLCNVGSSLKEIECSIGYYYKNYKIFKKSKIIFNTLIIDNIRAFEYIDRDKKKSYFYYVTLKSTSDKEFVFSFFIQDLKYFFKYTVKELNKDLKNGEDISNINIYSYLEITEYGWELDRFSYSENGLMRGLYDLVSMILNFECDTYDALNNKGYFRVAGLHLKMKSDFTYNPYVKWLLAKYFSNIDFHIIDFYLRETKKMWVANCNLLDIEWLREEIELGGGIKDYIKNKIVIKPLVNIIMNFNKNFYLQGFKRNAPIWEDGNYKEIEINEEFLYFFNFILKMRHWSYEDGSSRVGRDDSFWNEDTYIIPVETGFLVPEKLLQDINQELDLSFKYHQDENRYFCRINSNFHYGGGAASRIGRETGTISLLVPIIKLAVKYYIK